MRNLKTRAVFDRTFKAGEKFKEPDLAQAPASYLYSDSEGSHFMDQESYETLTLQEDMLGDALDFLVDGQIVQILLFNGTVIGLQMPQQVELTVTYTEPGIRGDTASGQRQQGRHARDGHRDPRAAVRQAGREGPRAHRDARVHGTRVGAAARTPSKKRL